MAYWHFDQHNPSYDPHPPVDFVNSGGDNAYPAESYARRLSILEMAHQDQMRVNNEQKITNFEFLVAHQDQLKLNHEQKVTNSKFRLDLTETKGIQRKRREECLDMYLEEHAYSLEGQKKARALYKKVDSKVDAHHEKLEWVWSQSAPRVRPD